MPTRSIPPRSPFRHEAVFYSGKNGFLDAVAPFVREGVEAGEPVLVVVDRTKIGPLRGALGPAAERVVFEDMARVGDNPARIIPAWRRFLDEHPGRPVRGVGEPIGPQRSAEELVECHRHESLLNVAFADAPGFTLVCPYDTAGLAPEVVAEARRTHPSVCERGRSDPSGAYARREAELPFARPLPEPPAHARRLAFDLPSLGDLRTFVCALADQAGLSPARAADLCLAVSELAANSVRHGGGRGVLRVWHDARALVCEVSDAGRIHDPLAGRRVPQQGQIGGYGLWLANHLCDLVQIRSFVSRSVVRVHMRLA